jgi:hypothetical protein
MSTRGANETAALVASVRFSRTRRPALALGEGCVAVEPHPLGELCATLGLAHRRDHGRPASLDRVFSASSEFPGPARARSGQVGSLLRNPCVPASAVAASPAPKPMEDSEKSLAAPSSDPSLDDEAGPPSDVRPATSLAHEHPANDAEPSAVSDKELRAYRAL